MAGLARLVTVILLATFLSVAHTHAATLQHDLFDRPALDGLKPVQPQTVKPVTPAPAPPEWKAELRAIIAGSGTAIVNVDGRIVQMGQDIEGYRLADVRDRQAVFVKDGMRYTLYLKPVRAPDAPTALVKPAQATSPLGSLRTSDLLSPVSPTGPDVQAPVDQAKPTGRGAQ